MYHYHRHLKHHARLLRKNLTEAEVKLWNVIRKNQINGLRFCRQNPLGSYIVDFYCPPLKLVIEIDGGQHYEDAGLRKDKLRDEYLEKTLKLKVLRFTNLDVIKNIEGVSEKIREQIPLSPPFKKGETEDLCPTTE